MSGKNLNVQQYVRQNYNDDSNNNFLKLYLFNYAANKNYRLKLIPL